MKILAKGTEPLPWSTKTSCITCRSKLEIVQDDFFQTNTQADDDRTFNVSILCPVCGERMVFDGALGNIPRPPAGGYPREAAWRKRRERQRLKAAGAPESEHELTRDEKALEASRLYGELRDDVLKGLKIANTLTLDTQSVEEACTALVELTRKARKERDDYEAKALKFLRVTQVLTAWVQAKQAMSAPMYNPITQQERIDAMSLANANLEAVAKDL